MNTLTVFLEIRKKEKQKLFQCLDKESDYIGAFAFVNEDIKNEDEISPFNNFYNNIISLGNLEIDNKQALTLLTKLVLNYIKNSQIQFYQNCKIFISDSEVVTFLNKNISSYKKEYCLDSLEFIFIERNRNQFVCEMISNVCLLDNSEYSVIDEKLYFLRTLTKNTHTTKQKRIEELSRENVELHSQISNLTYLLNYYRNERG